MAGNLRLRNLDDNLIARLKRRAARHGRSTEAEHGDVLRQVLSGDVEPSFDTLAGDPGSCPPPPRLRINRPIHCRGTPSCQLEIDVIKATVILW